MNTHSNSLRDSYYTNNSKISDSLEPWTFSALIALVWVLISVGVSIYTSYRNNKTAELLSRKSNELLKNNEKNKIYEWFAWMILQKRIEYYPELWEMVSNVYGIKKMNYIPWTDAVKHNRDDIRPKLRMWRKKFWIFLSSEPHLISFIDTNNWPEEKIEISSLTAFRKLEQLLNLELKHQEYNTERKISIDKYRNLLLKTLRYDIWITDKSLLSLKDSIF